jgi:tetratricopeptide (TPR) repeat protein
MLLVELGRFSEAIANAKRAQVLDPSSSIHANAAMVLHLAGRYDAAIQVAREALDLEPNSLRAQLSLGLALEQKGLLKEAIETFKQGGGVSGQAPSHASALGHCYARAGNIREAESTLKLLEKGSQSGCLWQALIHLGLGHESRALELLEQAREEKEFEVVLLKVDKRFGPLRANPRFQVILEQVGLSDRPSTA